MHNIRKYIAFIIGFLAVITPVVSMAIAPAFNFNGSYLGGDIGAAWGISNYQTNPGCGAIGVDAVFCNVRPAPSALNGSAVSASGTGRTVANGITGGVQVGHNWQKNKVIFGGEADFGALSLNKPVHVNGVFPTAFLGTRYSLTESISTNWLATVRGRIGLTIHPQLLLYATSGVAFTNYKVSSSYSDNAVNVDFPGGSGSGTRSSNRTGWTAGGGGEWLLMKHFSIKAEYLYAAFNSMNVLVPVSNTPLFTQTIGMKANLSTNIVRFGVNYQFA